MAILPLILVANPSLPAEQPEGPDRDYARKRPGEINFASTGNGSSNHLAGEMLKSYAKVQMVHVPYKGASPALIDLLRGPCSSC